jgi:hypothetical protein
MHVAIRPLPHEVLQFAAEHLGALAISRTDVVNSLVEARGITNHLKNRRPASPPGTRFNYAAFILALLHMIGTLQT